MRIIRKGGAGSLATILCAVAVTAALPAWAEEPTPPIESQITHKLVRGLLNLSTGWMEVPRQIYEVGRTEGWMTGVLRGPFDGIGMLFARTAAGVVEVATFPVPLPTYQPLVIPAYVWEPEGQPQATQEAPPIPE